MASLLILLNQNQLPEGLGLLNYGVAGAVILLSFFLFKYIILNMREGNKERDEKYITIIQNQSLSYAKTEASFREALEDVKDALLKVDDNYNAAIDKFIAVINKQMDNTSYVASELTKLSHLIENSLKNDAAEVRKLKEEVIKELKNLTLHYELRKKEDRS